MDAFCGFVRGIRGKSEELGVLSSKCGLFPANFQPPLGRFFLWPAPLAEPGRSIMASRTAGLHSRQARFLIGAKATA